MECIPITAQYSVTWHLKYVINGKIQTFGLSRVRTWCMRSTLSEKCLESWAGKQSKSKSQVQKGRKSYFGDCHRDVMTRFMWLIKFLGDKLLYGHIPDPFPRNRVWPRETNVEAGRYRTLKTPYNLWTCNLSRSNSVETEVHFVMECPAIEDLAFLTAYAM